MRVLITGTSGQVGNEPLRQAPVGFEERGYGSAELDISAATEVEASVERFAPQLIINAPYTAVDKAEGDAECAYAMNSAGVANLARTAEATGIPLLHLSTDYVFAGGAVRPYREDDPSSPASVYGASKLAGERAMAELCGRHIILRTSWVFGSHGSNFVKTMLRLGKERQELGVVADQYGSPTSAASIAACLWQIARRWWAGDRLPWGIYHFSGAPACNWHGYAVEIFRQAVALGLLMRAPQVDAITTSEYPTPARRPEFSVLDCSKIARELGIHQSNWRSDLQKVLMEINDQADCRAAHL